MHLLFVGGFLMFSIFVVKTTFATLSFPRNLSAVCLAELESRSLEPVGILFLLEVFRQDRQDNPVNLVFNIARISATSAFSAVKNMGSDLL